MDQYMDIITASDAWLIADDNDSQEDGAHVTISDLKPTNSARRVKALVEQVTGRGVGRFQPISRSDRLI